MSKVDPLADRGAVRVKADVRGNDRDETMLPVVSAVSGYWDCLLHTSGGLRDAGCWTASVAREVTAQAGERGLAHQPRARRAKACSAGPPSHRTLSLSPQIQSKRSCATQ
jgi:hypothetical protein